MFIFGLLVIVVITFIVTSGDSEQAGPASPVARRPATAPAHGTSEARASEMSREITTQSDFENSEFCRIHRCKQRDSWPLQGGGVNQSYVTSVGHLSVDIQTDQSDDPKVTGFGLMFHDRDRLSGEDMTVISALVRSTDQTTNHNRAISFVKTNAEVPVCTSCRVGESARSIADGKFRIWAGKSGREQVIIFKRIGSVRPARTAGISVLRVSGSVVNVGDLADDVFPIVKSYNTGMPETRPDPTNPGSLAVTHTYRIDGSEYRLEFRRREDPGPYRLYAIHKVGND